MNKWLFHQNGFTRNSLSATVTRVSDFVEDNLLLLFFIHRQSSPSRCIQSLNAQNRFNHHALSMFKALKKGFK